MEEKVRAVVLRGVDYKDNDKILTLFSLESGLITAAIRGVKKAGAKLKFAAQPFCFCEYVLSVKGDRRSVTSAEIIESFYPVREDIRKLYAGSVALEYTLAFMQENMESREYFLHLMEFFQALCYNDVSPKTALVRFLLGALALSGYEIDLGGCKKCRKTIIGRAFFDFNLGAAACEECRESTDVEINPNTLKLLAAAEKSYEFPSRDPYPATIENKAIKLLSYFVLVKAGVKLKTVDDLLLLQ